MVKYPYSSKVDLNQETDTTNYANRGMDFEHAVNSSNQYYLDNDLAVISKRPTPIHIVKVDYAHNCRIKDAYFEKQSSTDYNGIYKGKYVDFECKETKSKTSLSLHNISSHQIRHLQRIKSHGGITFFLIFFYMLDEVYLLDAEYIIDIYQKKERQSIPLSLIKEKGILIEQSYSPRLKYLDAIDKVYFNEKITQEIK